MLSDSIANPSYKIKTIYAAYIALVGLFGIVALLSFASSDWYTPLIVMSGMLAVSMSLSLRYDVLENGILAITVITSIWALIEFLFDIPWLSWTGNINLMGYVASIGVLVSIRARSYHSFVICIAALIISQCTGAWIVVAIYILYYFRGNRLVFVLSVIATIAILIFNGSRSYTNRLMIIANVIDSGLSLFGKAQVIYSFQGVKHAHNLLIQSLLSFGFVPTLILIPITYLYFKIVNLSPDAFIFIAVSSIVDFIYWWPGMLPLVVLFAVWASREERHNEE